MNPNSTTISSPAPTDTVRLPEDIGLERAVLGALLLESDKLADIRGIVSPEAFTDTVNRRIYDVLCSLDDRGGKIDLYTAAAELKNTPGDPVSLVYLSDLTQGVGSAVNVSDYARRLQDIHTRRRLALFSQELAARAAANPEGVMDWATAELARIADGNAPAEELRPVGEVLAESLRMLEQRQRARTEGRPVGVTTGLRKLDAVTGGWRGGQLIVVGGRPGMGKSAAALHFAASAARQGIPVCIFSLEMRAAQLTDRLLVGDSGTDAGRYRTGDVEPAAWEALERANAELAGLPVYISDRPAATIAGIRAQCRRMHRQGKCGLAVIDYLQLLDTEGDARNRQTREREVANMSRAAKQLAKELDIPVIVLAQLSRGVEDRADKVPQLADLRESGAIEQDADVVIFVYRPEYYKIPTVETARYGTIPAEGLGEFIVAKQRDGRTGTVYFRLNDSVTKISDYDAPVVGATSEGEPF